MYIGGCPQRMNKLKGGGYELTFKDLLKVKGFFFFWGWGGGGGGEGATSMDHLSFIFYGSL